MKKKRIHCPKCNKLMSAKTKQCKFCEKKLVKTNNEISLPSLYAGWMSSMLVFYMVIFYLRRSTLDTTMLIPSFLLITVIVGIAFFTSLLKKLLEPAKKGGFKHYGKSTFVVFILFFVVLYNYEAVEASLGFSPPQINNSIIKNTATTKPALFNTCYKTNGTAFQTTAKCDEFSTTPKATAKPQKTTTTVNKNTSKANPNAPVHCPINERCGGGTMPLTVSECQQSICCETSTGNWEFMKNGNNCNNGSSNNNQQNNTYNDTYTPTTYYSCTLNYRSNGTFTYDHLFKTKEDCDAEQTEIDQLYNNNYSGSTTRPTYTQSAPTPAPTWKPVEFRKPTLSTPRPTPKDCYNVGGGDAIICL